MTTAELALVAYKALAAWDRERRENALEASDLSDEMWAAMEELRQALRNHDRVATPVRPGSNCRWCGGEHWTGECPGWDGR